MASTRTAGAATVALSSTSAADGPGNALAGPHNGLQAPMIVAATQISASGTAASVGADSSRRIQVFAKQSSAAGEIDRLIGETEAAPNGNWSVTFTETLPPGTSIAASYTRAADGTSEFGYFTLPSAPPQPPETPALIPQSPAPASTLRPKCRKRKGKGAKRSARKCKTKRRKR